MLTLLDICLRSVCEEMRVLRWLSKTAIEMIEDGGGVTYDLLLLETMYHAYEKTPRNWVTISYFISEMCLARLAPLIPTFRNMLLKKFEQL